MQCITNAQAIQKPFFSPTTGGKKADKQSTQMDLRDKKKKKEKRKAWPGGGCESSDWSEILQLSLQSEAQGEVLPGGAAEVPDLQPGSLSSRPAVLQRHPVPPLQRRAVQEQVLPVGNHHQQRSYTTHICWSIHWTLRLPYCCDQTVEPAWSLGSGQAAEAWRQADGCDKTIKTALSYSSPHQCPNQCFPSNVSFFFSTFSFSLSLFLFSPPKNLSCCWDQRRRPAIKTTLVRFHSSSSVDFLLKRKIITNRKKKKTYIPPAAFVLIRCATLWSLALNVLFCYIFSFWNYCYTPPSQRIFHPCKTFWASWEQIICHGRLESHRVSLPLLVFCCGFFSTFFHPSFYPLNGPQIK